MQHKQRHYYMDKQRAKERKQNSKDQKTHAKIKKN